MLRKAWYAVLSSEELLDKPVKVSVHGTDFLLLQDPDGVPHAFNAYCPHRGCDLSLGTISFVHPETTGSDISPVVEGPEYSATEDGIIIHPVSFAPSHPMQPVTPPIGMGERTEIEFIFPNNWIIRTPMGDEHFMCIF